MGTSRSALNVIGHSAFTAFKRNNITSISLQSMCECRILERSITGQQPIDRPTLEWIKITDKFMIFQDIPIKEPFAGRKKVQSRKL